MPETSPHTAATQHSGSRLEPKQPDELRSNTLLDRPPRPKLDHRVMDSLQSLAILQGLGRPDSGSRDVEERKEESRQELRRGFLFH